MKSSDIKVLSVKNRYNFSENENEILTKQSANLERKPLIYNNNHNIISKTNFFNDNSFFLDDYEIISLPIINTEENQSSFKNKNIDKAASFNSEVKITNPTKLAKIVQKQPVFPIKNEDDFYVRANTLMQNNTQQHNCTNCLQHLPTNSSLSLLNTTGNDKYDKKIAKINAKTNYYRARYEQLRVKKQLQIDWKCCSKHISANCQLVHQDKHVVQATQQVSNLNNFDQQHNNLMLESLQNEKLDSKSILLNSNEIEQIRSNSNKGKKEFKFDEFRQDFNNLSQQNNEEINFILDDKIDLLTNSDDNQKIQNVSNSLIKNTEQTKNNKLRINFVETNPNEKRKIKPKHNFEENSVGELQSQIRKDKTEDDFDMDLFADFDNVNESTSNHDEKSLTINPVLIENQQLILEDNKKMRLHKIKNQDKKKIKFTTDKVIAWNNFSNLSLKIILVATIALAICLALLFKQQINNSKTQWNIMWFLNKNNSSQKSGWLNFIYTNTFLIASLIYSIFFIVPLIIFGRKKMFITSLTVFMIGLVTWTVFACLGFFKYGTFKVNKIIASLEATSLGVSWIVFTLFLIKLVKYNKQVKNRKINK